MKVILIEWLDSTSSSGWDSAFDLELSNCKTVGFLVKKDKEKVVVIQSNSDNVHSDGRFAIPRSCIKSIRELE